MTMIYLGVATASLLLSARFVSTASSIAFSSCVLRIDLRYGHLSQRQRLAVEISYPDGTPAHHKRKQHGGPQSIGDGFCHVVRQECDYDRSQFHEHSPLRAAGNHFSRFEPAF